MKLTEGQLFTIETLNKVVGFVWPEDAVSALVSRVEEDNLINFFSESCWVSAINYQLSSLRVVNWSESLITREQFDSVDGWVRKTGGCEVGSALIDVMFENGNINRRENAGTYYLATSCITHWRYHKPEAKTVTPQPTQETVPNNKTFIPSVGDEFKTLTPNYANLGSLCCVGITTNKHIIGEAASGLLFTFAPDLPFVKPEGEIIIPSAFWEAVDSKYKYIALSLDVYGDIFQHPKLSVIPLRSPQGDTVDFTEAREMSLLDWQTLQIVFGAKLNSNKQGCYFAQRPAKASRKPSITNANHLNDKSYHSC